MELKEDSTSTDLSPDFGPALELRDTLARGRTAIRDFHARGGSGEQVTAALTALCDRAVGRAYEIIDKQTGGRDRIANELAIVAVGGYGRGDLAPFSDVDLLFLTAQPPDTLLRNFVSALVRLLWDAGLSIAQSVRTPQDCIAFARGDLTAWTAITEARLLRGNIPLFKELIRRIDGLVRRRSVRQLAEHILSERTKEQEDDPNSTVYLLEPNIKKSAGGLRDYHLIRWVGRTRYGTPEPAVLYEQGHLSEHDCEQILAARELLLRIRNELHFDAASAQDTLTLDEQARLSQWLGWSDAGGLIAVERFMQDYYRQTTALNEIALRFVGAAWKSQQNRWKRLFSRRRLEGRFMIEAGAVHLPDAAEGDTPGAEIWLALFELARCHNATVDPRTLERARAAVPACEVTLAGRRLLLDVLNNPQGLGRLLREIHGVGLLSRLIPPFAHIHCLIQFNQYHKYTVDEHTLRVVEAACRRLDDPGPLGVAYRQIHRKDLLHLALLLHDVGKGYPGDHSEKGCELADTVSREFGLSPHEHELLTLLIRHHLLMANISQRRDLSDPQTVVQLVRTVGTPEALQMLFVLTAADTEAVGPGNLTSWKESLLIELYTRAMQELTGQSPGEDQAVRAQRARDELLAALPAGLDADWSRSQLALMPEPYLLTTEPARILSHLQSLRHYTPGEIVITATYSVSTGVSTYAVILGEGRRPGIFASIAGVLASAGFQILSAQIVTRPDGVAIDTFETNDLDYAGAPPQDRGERVSCQITDVLLGRRTVESLMGNRFVPRDTRRAVTPLPAQAEIDNASSDRFTILEVFANDRQGLLYVITRTLFELGLSIHSAKIATHVDQIVDVFYLTDSDGNKITDDARLNALRETLLQRINETPDPARP